MTLAAFPIGARVRVVGDPEWVGPSSHAMVGLVGVVVAHDEPYVVVALDGEPAPWGANGFPLYPNEVEAVS